MTNENDAARVTAAIEKRFGEHIEVNPNTPGLQEIARMVEHCTHRKWTDRAVEPGLLRLLCATALSAPSKSDLQQTDIINVADRAVRQSIVEQIHDMDWIMEAPVFLVFCGNNRRLRLMSQWRNKPFPNDHMDQFFNAACDPAIILGQFLCAAEAVGMGCCPVSHVRNNAERVSEILGLPLSVTVHTDRYDESRLPQLIDEYDHRRHELQPYGKPRDAKRFGPADFYGWSEDKARQYGVDERENFGAFVRKKRFGLD